MEMTRPFGVKLKLILLLYLVNKVKKAFRGNTMACFYSNIDALQMLLGSTHSPNKNIPHQEFTLLHEINAVH